jgi:hypothetical protein
MMETVMQNESTRRTALVSFGLATIGAAAAATSTAAAEVQHRSPKGLFPAGATALADLTARLARAPRRRDFRTVPMVLDDPMLWDHEALDELFAYTNGPRQVSDNTDIAGPWLSQMRNALNAQIWSFRNPDFITVSATHGTAQLALLDQIIWDKYQLARLTGGKFTSNTLIERNAVAEADRDHKSVSGAFSGENNTIPAMMDRGVVFMACHFMIWELTGSLLKKDVNPDGLSHEAMAAEITNHLIPGVVLTPGMSATIPELQQRGYRYIA